MKLSPYFYIFNVFSCFHHIVISLLRKLVKNLAAFLDLVIKTAKRKIKTKSREKRKSELSSPHVFVCCVSQFSVHWHFWNTSNLQHLTRSHTISTFTIAGKGAYRKHFGKLENGDDLDFLLFPLCFLLYKRQLISSHQQFICRLQIL